MKFFSNHTLQAVVALGTVLLAHPTMAASFTIQNYNEALPVWGASWQPGSDSISGYYPSFYTGFAPRSSTPSRIHVRLARGNQTRVSVVLDEQTVTDYLFDLAKRYEFYQRVTTGPQPALQVNPNGAVLPQLDFFNSTVESDAYGILSFVEQARAGRQSPEAIYRKGLETMAALNPGRVFPLRINLTNEFKRWRTQVREMLGSERDTDTYFTRNSDKAITAIDSLLFGRINFTGQLNPQRIVDLASAVESAQQDWTDDEFVASAVDLFRNMTDGKYNFRVLDEHGRWVPALHCPNAANCTLTYPEFTAVYPTGSVKSQTRDQFGNSIANFATPGLWSFIDQSGGRGVDNIRDDSFYGWIPKMDYEEIGNGFHNPAVRFANIGSGVKSVLGIPPSHSSLWSVMRGGVSHGCSRLPAGHIWEMRHIFPVEPENMTQVFYFGSDPRDFDLYDIDGNGQLEVIGVEYLISYGLQGSEGLGSREGSNLEIASSNKLAFYQNLYGSQNVFTVTNGGQYLFSNPSVSLPSSLDYLRKRVQVRLAVNGTFPLYEAAYERDKIQFYSGTRLNKRLTRLMGRVRGCAPTSDKNACGEAAFDREAAQILR